VSTEKERKTISIKENPTRDVGIHMGTYISLVKQLGLSLSSLNMTVMNCHVIEENANQYGR
jgi:hypothetical protein